jgi:hypothetical protein
MREVLKPRNIRYIVDNQAFKEPWSKIIKADGRHASPRNTNNAIL